MSFGPGSAAVARIGGADLPGPRGRACVEPQLICAERDDRGLDDTLRFAPIERTGNFLYFSARLRRLQVKRGNDDRSNLGKSVPPICTSFDPTGPGAVTLNGGSANDGPVCEYERFRSDRAVQSGWKVLDGRPCLSVVQTIA